MVTRQAQPVKTTSGKQQKRKSSTSKPAPGKPASIKPAQPLISEKFPRVSGIVIYMTYYQEGINPVLMLRTVNIFPKDPVSFSMACMMKGCMDGGFNLTRMIIDMIKKRKPLGKGESVCKGKRETHTSCRARISYEIKITYHK